MTRIFIEETGHMIAPFNDPPGEVLIANRRLADHQSDAIEQAGLERVDNPDPPCLIIPDTLYCNAGTLRQFVERAAGQNAVCVLGDSLHGRYTTPVQRDVERTEDGWRFSKVRFVSGTDEEPIDALIDPDEKVISFETPQYYLGRDKFEFGIPKHPMMALDHWCHILWANQIAGGVDARNRGKIYWTFTLLWAVFRALSFNKWKVLAKMNRIGRKCDVHPSAIVEYSTLGDGVTIGAGAQVRFSTVGAGSTIMPGALVEGSTLGEKCIVSQRCTLKFAVLYPEAVAGQKLMQLSVLGRQAVTTHGSNCIDLNFHQDIRVPLDGQLHNIGQNALGCAIGHRTRFGTGFWIASGRSIPNDYFIIRRPSEILYRVPDGLEEEIPLAVYDGTLVPVAKLRAPDDD